MNDGIVREGKINKYSVALSDPLNTDVRSNVLDNILVFASALFEKGVKKRQGVMPLKYRYIKPFSFESWSDASIFMKKYLT